MASHTAKAAHRGDGGDLRKASSGQEVISDIGQDASWPQDRLIGAIEKNTRSRIECRLKSFEGVRRIVLGIRDVNGRGGFKDTGPTLTLPPIKLKELHKLLDEAEAACREEGVLP